jgi:hypothetical protein
MVFSRKSPARTLSRIVASLAMLPCLSAASCCCAQEALECHKTIAAYYVDGRVSSCSQVAWSCLFDSHRQHRPEAQSATECGCECPHCCCDGPVTCAGVQLGFVGKCRKKPSGPSRQSRNGTTIGQDYPPTPRFVRVASGAPSPTSNAAARCSLLCRFLL